MPVEFFRTGTTDLPTFTSSDSSILRVQGGAAIGRAAGFAYILAQLDGVRDSVAIRVQDSVGTLTLTVDSTRIRTGSRLPLTATIASRAGVPLNGRVITWRSSNNVVLATQGTGRTAGAVAANPGSTLIIAESEGVADTVTIEVIPLVASVTHAPLPLLQVGDTLRLSLRDTAGNAIQGRFLSVTGRSGTAELDSTGRILAMGPGSVVLRAAVDKVIIAITVQVDSVDFVAVTAGVENVCATSSTGQVFCWGTNHDAQLGNPRLPPSSNWDEALGPTLVALPDSTTGVGSIRLWHLCSIVGTTTWCWGRNQSGQLGAPEAGPCVTSGTTCAAGPVAVSGGLAFVSVSAGGTHTCALDASGQAWCWGFNARGQLGNGSTSSATTPQPVSGGRTYLSIEAGWKATCALGTDSLAWCWGDNMYGQLGDASTPSSRATPGAVAGGRHFRSLTVGADFACGLTAGGAAWCWGLDGGSQLGSDSSGTCEIFIRFGTSCSNLPVPVSGSHNWRTLVAGTERICAIEQNDALWCWGANTAAPTLIPSVAVASLSVSDYPCIVGTNGLVYCSDFFHPAPVRVPGQR